MVGSTVMKRGRCGTDCAATDGMKQAGKAVKLKVESVVTTAQITGGKIDLLLLFLF